MDLYMTFVDLTKAFDTVSRDGLWKITAKFGCPISWQKYATIALLCNKQPVNRWLDLFDEIKCVQQIFH